MQHYRIRQERRGRNWTLKYVGEQVGLTQPAIHDIEKGRRKPSYEVLCKLEDLFNLSHRKLFAVARDNNPSS